MEIVFNEMQMDMLREIANIASGNAASALSKILNKKISMKVPEIRIVPIEEATQIMGNMDSLVAGIHAKIIGDFSGNLLLMFPRDYAILLIDKLFDKTTKTPTLSELDSSAIQEIGNIISAAFVNAIAGLMQKALFLSIPKLTFDMLGAIADYMLIDLAEHAQQAMIMKIEFEDVPKTISGHFFLMPNPGSLEMLLMAIESAANKHQA